MRAGVWVTALTSISLGLTTAAHAADADESRERQLTTDEIERWLDAPPGTPASDGGPVDPLDAPPPAPRRHGLVLETGLGAVGHIGPLKNIVPVAPRFEIRLGVEPLDWLMIFAEGDLVVASTSYASHPPPPRAYAHYGFGGGPRFTIELSERLAHLGAKCALHLRLSRRGRVEPAPRRRAGRRVVPGELAPRPGRPRRHPELRRRPVPGRKLGAPPRLAGEHRNPLRFLARIAGYFSIAPPSGLAFVSGHDKTGRHFASTIRAVGRSVRSRGRRWAHQREVTLG
jgi:hypothetical protein